MLNHPIDSQGLGRLLHVKIRGLDLLAGYVMLLFLFPNDFYFATSLYTFTTPTEIAYKWGDFCVSWLYLPTIVGGIYCYVVHCRNTYPNIFLFLTLLLLKDLVLWTTGYDYVFTHLSFEQYWLWFTSACMMYILIAEAERMQSARPILNCMFAITVAMLIVAIVLHVTPGQYDYVNRYTSTNMAHGETALLLGSASMLLLTDKHVDNKLLAFGAVFVLVIATGTRKDLVYMLLFGIIFLIVRFVRGNTGGDRNNGPKVYKRWSMILAPAVMLTAVVVLAFFSERITEIINIGRVTDLFESIFGDRAELTSDYSIVGRSNSLEAGLAVVSENPWLGKGFSFYAQQLSLQGYGFPTFPHFFWLFNWELMGLLVLIPIIRFLKSAAVLMGHGDGYSYLAAYLVLYCTLSGGEWSSFKIVLWLMFLYGIVVVRARRYRKGAVADSFISGNDETGLEELL